MKKPIIKLKDVWKVYQMGKVEVPALRGLNMEIFPGDLVAVIGSSGSGKSTCMNMVGCLDVPTKGQVLLDGKDISRMDESDLAEVRGKKIGFVFQQFNLFSTLSALDNVIFPTVFQNVSSEKRRERAEELLKMVGLGERMMHKPNEMSGGEQQRVAVARALVNDPEIILADEPTGNLDSATGKKVVEMLVKLNKEEGKTIIIVTHDANVAKVGKKIFRLLDGQIVGKDKRGR